MKVVVVGGGFAGLQAVRALRRARVDVTLVDRRNFHLFQPLLYQVATGALTAVRSPPRCAGCSSTSASRSTRSCAVSTTRCCAMC
jgi:NADH dehydrogenase FAD-containing subunit